jgi:hypothetical protein
MDDFGPEKCSDDFWCDCEYETNVPIVLPICTSELDAASCWHRLRARRHRRFASTDVVYGSLGTAEE